MDLSEIGQIANSCWNEIPNHFPFVELGAHIIMPNHVHGIVIIDKPMDQRNDQCNFDIPDTDTNQPKNKFGPQSKILASIIRGFKIGVTKNGRCINGDFA